MGDRRCCGPDLLTKTRLPSCSRWLRDDFDRFERKQGIENKTDEGHRPRQHYPGAFAHLIHTSDVIWAANVQLTAFITGGTCLASNSEVKLVSRSRSASHFQGQFGLRNGSAACFQGHLGPAERVCGPINTSGTRPQAAFNRIVATSARVHLMN